jgi:hypothetical protein
MTSSRLPREGRHAPPPPLRPGRPSGPGRRPAPADDNPFKGYVVSHLTGTVRDAGGKPIDGARVLLNNVAGPYATYGGNWVVAGPNGTYSLRIEGTGIAPAVAVDAPAGAYRDRDPTWAKAIDVLRTKVAGRR